jgi:cation diffusion facilitator family transporter
MHLFALRQYNGSVKGGKKMKHSLAQRVVLRTLAGNIFLAVLKLAAGIMAGSAALVAEAVHSTGDILASLGVLLAFRFSGKAADERHHFGHGKIESLCSCLVGLLLVYIGYELVTHALAALRAGTAGMPEVAALYVTVICIALKEGMYRYTMAAACKSGSQLLFADAWHHRTDMMILTGVLAGVVAARLGYPLVDSFVALGISVLIIRLGIGICRKGLGDLLDTAPDEELLAEIRRHTEEHPAVRSLDCLRARCHGSEIQLEMHISVDAHMRVEEGHHIAKNVKNRLMDQYPQISHLLVHINPWGQVRNFELMPPQKENGEEGTANTDRRE